MMHAKWMGLLMALVILAGCTSEPDQTESRSKVPPVVPPTVASTEPPKPVADPPESDTQTETPAAPTDASWSFLNRTRKFYSNPELQPKGEKK